jgi:hypothetical protein
MPGDDSTRRLPVRSRLAPRIVPEVPVAGPTPDRARAYYAPRALPLTTDHRTFEMATVQLAPDIDPRRMPTQLSLSRVRDRGAVPGSIAPVSAQARPDSRYPGARARLRALLPAVWLWAGAAAAVLVAGLALARHLPVGQAQRRALSFVSALRSSVAERFAPVPIAAPPRPVGPPARSLGRLATGSLGAAFSGAAASLERGVPAAAGSIPSGAAGTLPIRPGGQDSPLDRQGQSYPLRSAPGRPSSEPPPDGSRPRPLF